MPDLGACPTCLAAGLECAGPSHGDVVRVEPTVVDGEYSLVIVLDAALDVAKPDYIVTGWTWCVRCERQVWVGDHTGPQVLAGAAALCLRCANEVRQHLNPTARRRTVADTHV